MVGALRRFSAVFLTIVIATAGASYFVWTQVPVAYLSEASVVILLPNQEEGQERLVPSNPYQSAGDSAATVAADALVRIGNSPEFQARLANQGVTSVNTIEIGDVGGGVILALTASNTDPATAKADLSALATIIAQELRTRQIDSGAPESLLLTADVLIAPSDPIPLTGTRIAVVGAVAVIGVIIALAAVVLLGYLHRPRRAASVGPDEPREDEEPLRQAVGQVTEVGEPATVAPQLLAAIDRALELAASDPEPRREPQRDDVPPNALPLPFDGPVDAHATVDFPLDQDTSVEPPSRVSANGEVNSEAMVVDGSRAPERSVSAPSNPGAVGVDEAGSVTRGSSSERERQSVPAAPISPSAG